MKQVICINWGTKYGPRFVNRLYAMVARHITPPFSFTCFTDNAADMRPEIRCMPLPEIDYPLPVNTRGKWPKSRLWGEKLGDLTGPVLFLDLDVVVTGNLDEMFTFGDPDDVVLSRNPARPFERIGQTSVFRFTVGKLAPMQDLFKTDPQGFGEKYQWEQRFVTNHAPGGVKLFPSRWVRHFRRHNVPMFPLNFLLVPRLEPGTRVVIFPGGLHPQHAIDGGWKDADARGLTPTEHIARAIKQRDQRWFKRLRRYVRPTPWVADHWRE